MQATTPKQDAESLGKMCCSAGAIRHKGIVVACLGLVVLLTAASTVDLASLMTVDGSIDKKTFKFHPKPKPPELKPNQQRVNENYAQESNLSFSEEGLYPFKEGFWGNESKYGWLDQQGNVVIKARKFIAIGDFHKGLARVKVSTPDGDRWGFINKTGGWAIPARFEDVSDFNNDGLALESISVNGTTSHNFIGVSGKILVSLPHTRKVEFLSEGVYAVEDEQTSKVGLIDASGKELLPRIYTKISSPGAENSPRYYKYNACFDGQPWRMQNLTWFLIEDGSKKGAVDAHGNVLVKPLYEEVYSINDGVALVKKDHYESFINANGETVVPGKFQQATEYADLIAVADCNGQAHIIDKAGKTLNTPYKFVEPDDYMKWYNEGLAPVTDGRGRYAYIDKFGKTVIEPRFEAAFPFYDGRALVYDGKFWMFIDKNGNDISKLNIVRVDAKDIQSKPENGSYSVTVAGPLYEIFKAPKTREELHSTIDSWKRSAGYIEDVLKTQ